MNARSCRFEATVESTLTRNVLSIDISSVFLSPSAQRRRQFFISQAHPYRHLDETTMENGKCSFFFDIRSLALAEKLSLSEKAIFHSQNWKNSLKMLCCVYKQVFRCRSSCCTTNQENNMSKVGKGSVNKLLV